MEININDMSDDLYNSFNNCLQFTKDTQIEINNIIKYTTELYINSYIGNNTQNISQNYANYALKLMWGGVEPSVFDLMMQNYYESKIQIITNTNKLSHTKLETLRLQMLLIKTGTKLLHLGEKEEYIYFIRQLSSNKALNLNEYGQKLNI